MGFTISTPDRTLTPKTLIHLICRFRYHFSWIKSLPHNQHDQKNSNLQDWMTLSTTPSTHASTNSLSLSIKKSIYLLSIGCLGWIFGMAKLTLHLTVDPAQITQYISASQNLLSNTFQQPNQQTTGRPNTQFTLSAQLSAIPINATT